jgi:queuine/archaeosine tRNA-ribosyltransferase
MKANRSPDKQNLFPIVQGGFDVQLRETSMQQVRELRDWATAAVLRLGLARNRDGCLCAR